MKTLLMAINAKYIHSNLAIYDLRAYCKRYKEQIELAEYTINHYTEDILMDIYRRRPEMIAVSCYIWNIEIVKELGRNLQKILPDVPVWLGGPEVSYESFQFLKRETWAAGIMVGEGEQTFLELIEYYHKDIGALEQIHGLIYRDLNGAIQINPPREQMNLSRVPFAYDDLAAFENKIIYYESSRGCPFSCSYCLSSISKHLRFRDLELVKRELACFLEYKVHQVKFVDRTFNCDRGHAMEIWRFIKENDNGVTNFHFEIGADMLGEEELELLSSMRPGMVQLEIGVQSANPVTIKEVRRTMDLERLEAVVGRIRQGGNIHQHLDLIAGLPYEDYQSFCMSFNRVYAMKPEQLQLGFLKVLKGSYMHEHAKEYGLVYKEKAGYEVLYTKWLSFEEIVQLKAVEEMLEMYYNSGQFRHTLDYFVERFGKPYDFYKALSDFYERRNRERQSFSRIKKYELLLEFLSEQFENQVDIARELLTMDLYAREKFKSRPVWANDLTPYKDRINQFYKREAKERVYLPEYAVYNAKQLGNMTHIEIFCKVQKGEQAVLFNYASPNPLNKEAKICEIEL